MKYLLFFLMLLNSPFLCAAELAGLWKTYDLEIKPRSVIKFYSENGEYRADIVKLISKTSATCEKCKGENKGKPLLGMTIIRGLKPSSKGQWVDGEVLDTDSGHTYRCLVSLSEDGQVMHFRAFVKIPLFGKTIDWKRVYV